jgi:D-psicose/D-tagatose/L-ribulose 3-epimerase
VLYSMSNWIYDLGREPLAITFQRLKRYGYDGVELVGEPQQYDVVQVRRQCEQHGLRILSVLGWCIAPTDSRDLAHPEPRIRENSIAYIRQSVDFAVAVGAPLVVVIPAPAGRTAPVGDVSDEKAWRVAYDHEWHNAVEAVQVAAAYAEEKRVLLAIEPINRYESFMVNSTEQGLRFVHEVGSPAVKLHLDTFHMNIEDPDPAEAVRKAGASLVNMHIADSTRGPVGSGHTDFKAIVRALKEIGYAGALTLEPIPPHPNGFIAARAQEFLPLRDAYAEQSITRLRQYEAQVAP